MNNGVSYTSTKPLEEFEINKKNKPSDLISRQDAIDAVIKYCTKYDLRELLADIEVLPPVEQAQKTGKWTIEDCHAATYKYCCSECNAHHRARYDFCPTCGARMECGGEE